MEGDIWRCGFVAAVCLVLAGGVCLGDEDESFEYWAQFGVSAGLSEDWDFEFETELKYGDDAGELYCENVDFGVVYKGLADWVDLGLMFKREYEKDGAGDWRAENRPHMNLTFKGELFGLDVSDRSRFEFRKREAKEDSWRYRNMIKVKLPWEFTSLKLRPYFAGVLYRPERGAVQQEQVLLGGLLQADRALGRGGVLPVGVAEAGGRLG